MECKDVQDDQYCCTSVTSDAQGQCPSLLVHDEDKLCTFLEDIEECDPTLIPEGWKKGDYCERDFEWVENDFDCTQVCVNSNFTVCAECLVGGCAWFGECGYPLARGFSVSLLQEMNPEERESAAIEKWINLRGDRQVH